MESGFQQVAGYPLTLKEQIGSPVAEMRYLNAAYRAECKLNPVASHGKKNCTITASTRACRRPGDILFCRFTGQVCLTSSQKQGFQVRPLHSSSASLYRV
jgi:hypothetical protein